MTNHDYIDGMTDKQLIAMYDRVIMGGCSKTIERKGVYANGREIIFNEYGWEDKKALRTAYIISDYGEISSSEVMVTTEDERRLIKFMVMTFGQRWINDYFCYQSGIDKTELEKLICRNGEARK